MNANTRSSWFCRSILLTLAVSLTLAPTAEAKGGRRGGGGGGHPAAHAARAHHQAAPHRANNSPKPRAAKMPRAAAPARHNAAKVHNNTAVARANSSSTRTSGTSSAARTRAASASVSQVSPNSLSYGRGSSTRTYRSRGYGRGYRNHSYARRSYYGRSQGNNRAIVSRLRSVHRSLARLDHDYNGHRVKAMHSISLAIRSLSHRSMVYRGTGFSNNRNLSLNNNNRNTHRPRLTQAQSDARMNQAMRTTQGIYQQINQQGSYTTSHARARGHIRTAINHMGTALSIR